MVMDGAFFFRKKIGCAAVLRSTSLVKQLHAALEQHPWFALAPIETAQVVWSDRPLQESSLQQTRLYLGAVEGVNADFFDPEESAELSAPGRAFYVPSAHARALTALLKPIQALAKIEGAQVTALFPPQLLERQTGHVVPSMELFYQTMPLSEKTALEPFMWELARLLGANLTSSMQIQCLCAPIMQGPILTLTVQTKEPCKREDLLAGWMQEPHLPSTPSTLSAYATPQALFEKEPFIVYQESKDGPFARMQAKNCLIGQLKVKDNQIQCCIVPPDPLLSLLAYTESLVTAGAIYW